MKKKKSLLSAIAAVIIALFALMGIYISDACCADSRAIQALSDTDRYTVQVTEDQMVFSPAPARTGFIFYPGGKVEFTAYAPLMAALAEENILCVVPKMPWNMAFLNGDAAEGIPEQYPHIENWYIGGHSLGGSIAADYLCDHSGQYRGLVLLASYSTADLSRLELEAVSILGSQDGVLNLENYEKYRDNLPENTLEIMLEGGNHANFGSYGIQSGDGEARISPKEQTALTAEALLEFMGH